MTHLEKEYTVFVSILTLKEELKNAVNVICGISKVVIGLAMRILDNKIQNRQRLGTILESQLNHVSKTM